MKKLIFLLLVLTPAFSFGQSCELSNIRVETLDCDSNDSIEVTINLDFNNTSDSFQVRRLGRIYGTFSYTDLPVTIGKEYADCTTILEIEVIDQLDTLCRDELSLGRLCCDCRLANLMPEALGCNGDSCMIVGVNFIHNRLGSDEFRVLDGRGNIVGTYMYNELPLTIDCWPVTGLAQEKISVCDIQDTTCCIDGQFITVECDSCEITNLNAIELQCDTQKMFSILTEFDHLNPGDSGYIISVNDSIFGPFSYDTTERIIGPFQGGCDSTYTIIAYDNELANCADTVELDKPCCDPCVIGGIMAEALECNGDSCLRVRIEFDHLGTGSNGFELYTRNGLFGTYSYSQLPLIIDCFPITDPDSEYVRICDVDSVACCNEVEFPTLDCSPPCEINGLTAVDSDCDARGNFFVTLNFNHTNASDSFFVLGNGRGLGPFPYTSLPLTVGPFDADCRTIYEFVIRDVEDLLCSDEIEIGRKCCDTCEISNLAVQPVRCNGDSCMVINVDFDHSNGVSQSFDVFFAGGYFGTYNYSSLPVTINCFPITGAQFEYLKVCDVDIIDCCAETQFLPLDCSPDTCGITDLIVEAVDCNDQDTFMALIDFVYEDNCDDEFIVQAGVYTEIFKYDDLPVMAGPFAGGCGEMLEFIVTDSVCTTCTDTFDLVDACCEPCTLTDLEVIQTPCDSSGNFDVIIDVAQENASDSFFIRGNGRNVGPLSYSDLPYRLGPLAGDCMTDYRIEIADSEDSTCTIGETIGEVCCGDTCEISDLAVEVLRCQGDTCLVLELNLNVSGTPNTQFDVFDKNGYLRTYNYGDLPVIIECFPISGDTFEFIKVCDLGDPDCCAALEFTAVDCDELCAIYNVDLFPSMCDTNDAFNVDLFFQYDNVSDSFMVSGSGRLEGPFSYMDLPINLGPYPGDCTTQYEFVISDLEDPACNIANDLGTVCCLDTCSITDLVVEATDCDTNNMFFALIDLSSNGTSDSVVIQSNTGIEESFGYDQLPIALGPFDGDCSTSYEFVAFDQQDSSCRDDVSLGVICCDEACAINDLEVLATSCDSNHNFFAIIEFEAEGTSDSFYVSYDMQLLGPYSYDNVPLTVGPLEGDCVTEYQFTVQDASDVNCRSTFDLGTVCCLDTCQIEELTARAIRCNGDSCIVVTLDFDYTNVSKTFSVYDRSGLIGTFDYTSLPFLTIDCFPISGEDVEYLRVCDTTGMGCCAEIEFDTLDCTTTHVIDFEDSGWSIHFNVHTSTLIVDKLNDAARHGDLEISDLNGRILTRMAVHDDQLIDLTDYRQGIYFLSFMTNGQRYYLKFTKF